MKTPPEPVVFADAHGLWTRLVDLGSLEPNGRDEALVLDISREIGVPPTKLAAHLKAGAVSIEELVDAMLLALRPLSMMMRDLLVVFRRAAASRTDQNLLIEFEFEKSKANFQLDLRAFAVDVERLEKRLTMREAILHNLDTVGELELLLGSLPLGPGVVPHSLPSDAPAPVREAWNLWRALHERSRATLAHRATNTTDMSPQSGLPSWWELEQLIRRDWASKMTAQVSALVANPSSVSAELAEWYSSLPRGKATTHDLISVLDEFLSLPHWKKRSELYSAWVFTRILDALGPSVRIHASDGRILFSFSGSHLATREAPPRLHLWTELRWPLDSPRGKGRKRGIQPDYTLLVEPVTRPASAVLSVECKHYLSQGKKNFGLALSDYCRGLPQAQVALVNYGPTSDSVRELVETENRARSQVFGCLRPDMAESLARFHEFVARAVPPEASPEPGAGAIATGASPVPHPLRVIMSGTRPAMEKVALEILLTWTAEPSDLDLHAWVHGSSAPEHVCYRSKGALDMSPFALLDGDVVSVPGLERISVSRLDASVTVAVHRYSNSGEIREARSVVEVHAPTHTVRLEPPEGSGAWWLVGRFESSTGSFVPIQRMCASLDELIL